VFASARLAAGPVADAVAKTLALTLMIILICSVWLAVGASLASVFRDPLRSRIFNIALAVILVAATAATAASQIKRG
jgi:threonine/homoserine/homoserine lactone efflux protein